MVQVVQRRHTKKSMLQQEILANVFRHIAQRFEFEQRLYAREYISVRGGSS